MIAKPFAMAVLGFALLLPLALLEGAAAAQNAAKLEKDDEALDLIFLGDKQPVLIRLHVLLDGKSAQAHWNAYIEKWFRYLDADNDGLVDAEEIQRAPGFQPMLQLMRQGNIIPNRGQMLTMGNFNKEEKDKLTLADVQAHYRWLVGPVNVTAQSVSDRGFSEASEVLFRALDLNNDGKLSKEEILAAPKSLHKFDLDEDEWLTVQELAPTLGNNIIGVAAPPAMMGQPGNNAKDSFYQIRPGENLLPGRLLARYDIDKSQTLSRKEIGLDEATFAKLDVNKDGVLDMEELANFHKRPADVEFTVNLGKDGGTTPHAHAKNFAASVKESAPGVFELSLGDAQIRLLRSGPQTSFVVNRANQYQFYQQMIRQADVKKQGFVELSDLQGPQYQIVRLLFPYVDWNRDGKLTEQEVKNYMELQTAALDCPISMTIADQGRALFQLLDANRDGRLSQRELLSAWTRLAPFDKEKTGFIAKTDLARQFQISVQRGFTNNLGGFSPVFAPGNMNPPVLPAALPKGTPSWFSKMDTNGDGDISRAEFLGSREEFDRIDTDRDGLISPEEAIRYDALVRGKK